jgi:hypothetical protein
MAIEIGVVLPLINTIRLGPTGNITGGGTVTIGNGTSLTSRTGILQWNGGMLYIQSTINILFIPIS